MNFKFQLREITVSKATKSNSNKDILDSGIDNTFICLRMYLRM